VTVTSTATPEAIDVAVIRRAQTESGAILACPAYPTYRYAWLRDGSFCAVALDRAGEIDAAGRFHAWVAARVLGHEVAMRRAIEAVAAGGVPGALDHLPCRFSGEGLAPRDDGWGAFQMDGPGLWLWALASHARQRLPAAPLGHDLARAAGVAVEYVTACWRLPSFDAWEEHGDRLATSTLAACLAGLLAAGRLGLEPPGAGAAVGAIRTAIAERGERLGYLPRSDADDAVDASILWCAPLLGAISPAAPSWQTTLERVEAELLDEDGGVHRYAGDEFYGGGAWPVLGASLGLAVLQRGGSGDVERAGRCAAWIERQRSAEGHLPEQSSARPLHPGALPTWEAHWGLVARPLSWSHAMAILLRRALHDVDAGSDPAGRSSAAGGAR
jgi:GH15 family glucan-1,4-alpha-glucosidase